MSSSPTSYHTMTSHSTAPTEPLSPERSVSTDMDNSLQSQEHEIPSFQKNVNNHGRLPLTIQPTKGRFDTLTAKQMERLKQLWAVLLKAMNVTQKVIEVGTQTSLPPTRVRSSGGTGADSISSTSTRESEMSSASRKKKHAPEHLANLFLERLEPEEVKQALWHMARTLTPDNLLCRFLRARRWSVPRTCVLLEKAMYWRMKESGLDELQFRGEIGAFRSNDIDYINQYRSKKSYIRGRDKAGRPVIQIYTRRHFKTDQSVKCIKDFTLAVFEASLLMLDDYNDNVTFLFDMTDFTLFNMDYPYMRHLLKMFQIFYPESLGLLLVHNAPWVYEGVYNIIKHWMEPCVTSKFKFTKNLKELSQYIDMDQIPEGMGGTDQWNYEYIEPREHEADKLQDHFGREAALQERSMLTQKVEKNTVEWLQAVPGSEAEGETLDERRVMIDELRDQYWTVDRYIRAVTVSDRLGQIPATRGQVHA
ncbi:YALI0C05511p [Yarrowia lipolytica CLIB122]|uniref:YALI0C05511p n=2 Tax=Yarrowia lipolytica TaxID=4952 RepID=Q6CCY6_YARLI|nr:YALI0C05511p [Yarrowia lipolytica CLIB122]AOW02375.1 hypothetical protein YALI1_C07028g [Yarrowia lipolytica]KAB8283153.1 CRAL-TRIO domain-containing protein [Yarrowia lipolytica]KAE8173928.1 CRAL-TRIO domain-containing protein [Yarrowia lipolytica]KAJ8053092.1 CRAL-TRIO domain-containing protein [Yarrowia lipolytica]RMI95918.1 CRAL-TRIO domain-containing protein [Yarrowia lipolytica]|eukprot:XP_501476.1 YALI0C05511p [Yarrowia lipolytica CLIB122]